jgi:hypothetical protein
VRRVVEQGARLRAFRLDRQPVGVERMRVRHRGGELTPRAPGPAEPGQDPCIRAAVGGAGGRVRDLVLDELDLHLPEGIARELPGEPDHAGEQLCVAIAGPPARLLRLAGQPLRLLLTPGERRLDRRPQRRVPLEGGEAELVREPCVARDFLAPSGHVAELEEIRDAPVARLELGVAVPGLARDGDHLVGDVKPLVRAIRSPQRHVPRAQRGGERAGVAHAAGGRDRVGAERLRQRAVGRVVELDRKARLDAGAQHAFLGVLACLLQPLDHVRVDVDDRDPQPGEAERRSCEQFVVAAPEGQRARGGEGRARRVELPSAEQCVAAREQQRPGVVLGSGELERFERAPEALGSVLVREPVERPVTGPGEHLARTPGVRDRGRLEKVQGDLLEVAVLAQLRQGRGRTLVEPGAAQRVAFVVHRLADERVRELEPVRAGAGA